MKGYVIYQCLHKKRLCDANGCLDTHTIQIHHEKGATYRPWFEWQNNLGEYHLYFGHWAALDGKSTQTVQLTDTGCMGRQINAL